jgi:hypothetical protein
VIAFDKPRSPRDLLPKIGRVFELSARKIRALEDSWRPEWGAPVFTVDGRYRARRWTEWTQGFQFGSALLQFDATGEEAFLTLGRSRTLERMAPHLTHTGGHDHGFNTVSTYGNLWRLARERRFEACAWERRFYELALKTSGAVQARRWTTLADGGFIHSFNGAHSLFVDTMRTLRVLALGHLLDQPLLEEQDRRVSLLDRLVQHACATARYNVYFGRGRDRFDVRGRVAHESLFNVANGTYRGPSTQQGYSPFTTWARGLAWAMLGFAEQLEFLGRLPEDALAASEPGSRARMEASRVEATPLCGDRAAAGAMLREAAVATCDRYMEVAAADGVPYWDDGAPGLGRLPGWGDRPANPFNDQEPVDSSAAAIAAQGLLRLGRVLREPRYEQAGLRVLDTIFDEPYLSENDQHQGLLLHSVYHWPNGWDHVPAGSPIPRGESSQWGDYHAREAALYVKRLAEGGPYLAFFGDV